MPTNPLDPCRICDDTAADVLQPLPQDISTGRLVVARGRRWRVQHVTTHADCRELHLFDSEGCSRTLLWPFDRPNASSGGVRRLRAVHPRRWLTAVGALQAADMSPLTPRGTIRNGDVVPYQLAPALAIAGGEDRVLLADEVGLGKTIQAGWIAADLIAREPGARVLLAVPASVKRQWIAELETRFGITATAVSARWLRAMVADIPADVSPWSPPGIYVASLDFLKRPDVAASAARQTWDAIVVDEAHTATAPTERHAALAAIASGARRVVTITATPYSGNPASFASMTALGAADGSEPPVMFRRFREEVGDARQRRHRFARIRLTRSEVHLQRMLERYTRMVWRDAPQDVAGARLAMTILRKRALSSPAAVARSLRRRQALLAARVPAPRQLALFEDEDAIDDDAPSALLAVPGLEDARREERWLDALIRSADRAAAADSKRRFLQRLVSRLRHRSAIVFTEYRDTLLHLASLFPEARQLHGGLTEKERAQVQERFNRDGGLLLATDAAAEGLNLHHRCRVVVSYELPWNPARLEQRIGRVDRIGQRAPVHALTLTARDTAEDLVIANLARRLASIASTLGSRDRLASFLDEARVAGIVIGGAPLQADVAREREPASLVNRAVTDGARCIEEALRLERRGTAFRSSDETQVLVTALRAVSALQPGVFVVFQHAARTAEDVVIARRCSAVLVSMRPERPRSARHARELASAVLTAVGVPAALTPPIERWLADVTHSHCASIGRAIRRERALTARRSLQTLVQPGLFDSRAIDAAERLNAEQDQLTVEHTRRILALEQSQELRLTTDPAAVLIAWR